MKLKFGDILVCDFPFSDHLSVKRRPVAVINSQAYSSEKNDLLVIAVTSKLDKLLSHEKHIADWDEAGLFKSSAFKSAIFTIEKSRVYAKLGELSTRDKSTLKTVLQEIIDIF